MQHFPTFNELKKRGVAPFLSPKLILRDAESQDAPDKRDEEKSEDPRGDLLPAAYRALPPDQDDEIENDEDEDDPADPRGFSSKPNEREELDEARRDPSNPAEYRSARSHGRFLPR